MKKPNYAMKYILAVLLVATLTTTQIVSVTYARYIAEIDPEPDVARVAAFDVQITSDDNNDNVYLDAAGTTDINGNPIVDYKASVSKTYQVVNNSEVAVKCTGVRVYFKKQPPTGTNVKITDASGQDNFIPSTLKPSSSMYPFYYDVAVDWRLQPQASTPYVFKLVFSTDNTGASAASELDGIQAYVRVIYEQVDS